MNEEALKLRAEALEWWRALTMEDKRMIVEKYFPDKSFMLIAHSSMMIERLFIKQNK